MKIFAPLTLVMAMSAGAALAQSTVPMNGTMTGKASAKYYNLGEGHVVLHQQASYTLDFDGDTPFDGLPGECFGAIDIINGMPTGEGLCAWDDGAGNAMVTDWRVIGMTPERASVGVWAIRGGTGKFAGVTGGGGYVSANDPGKGISTLDITGAATMP